MNLSQKRAHEITMISEMIELYCRKKHHHKTLCPACQSLKEYAIQRTSLCPFMETKTFCSACRVHCYKSEYRTQIKEVMRFAGPRLIFKHPILVLKHGWVTLSSKLKGRLQ